MYQLSNFNKKDIKVKNYVRKGKLVKSYKKQIDIKSALLGAGGGVLGAGLLGGTFLLGKSRGIKQTTKLLGDMKGEILNAVKHQPNNLDEIVNKVISKIPKQEVNTKQIADDVISKLPKQSNVDSESIIRAVEDKVARGNKQLLSDIDNKLGKSNVNNTLNDVVSNVSKKDISITQVPLPKRKPSIPARLDKVLSEASDASLEKSIKVRTNELNKYVETQETIFLASKLKPSQDSLKNKLLELKELEEKSANKNVGEAITYRTDQIQNNTNELNAARKHLGLPNINLKKIDEYDFNYTPDKKYERELGSVIDRKKQIRLKYEEELNRRKGTKKATDYESVSDEKAQRLFDLIDDFSYSHSSIINFRSPICLGDVIYI